MECSFNSLISSCQDKPCFTATVNNILALPLFSPPFHLKSAAAIGMFTCSTVLFSILLYFTVKSETTSCYREKGKVWACRKRRFPVCLRFLAELAARLERTSNFGTSYYRKHNSQKTQSTHASPFGGGGVMCVWVAPALNYTATCSLSKPTSGIGLDNWMLCCSNFGYFCL